MKFEQLKVDVAGSRKKAPAWLPVVLLLVLIGLIGLIVHQLRRSPGPKPAQREYASTMEKIDQSIAELKEKIQERPPLDIEATMAKRPEPAPEPVPEPAAPTQQVAAAETPATTNAPEPQAVSLTQKVQELKEAVQAAVTKRTEPPAEPLPTLKGIFWSQTNPLALLNDELVGLKEKSGSFTVTAIAQDRVTVNDSDGAPREIPLYRD